MGKLLFAPKKLSKNKCFQTSVGTLKINKQLHLCLSMFQDLDILKIHALLEEETRGHYKVNYIITEAGRILELQYDNKFNINMGDFKLIKKFRLFDEKISLPSHGLVSI